MEGDAVWVSDKKQPSRFLEFIKKYAIIIIDAIIVLIIIGIFIVRALKSSTLEILIAPTFATVKVNGDTYPSSGSFNLFPGTYEVEISADGFEAKNLTLNLEADSIQKLYVYLTGENGDLSVYNNYSEEIAILRQISPDVIPLFQSEIQNELKSILPLTFSSYDGEIVNIAVSYSTTECQKSDFCITVDDSFGNGMEQAARILSDYGYDINDFEVIYDIICKDGVSTCRI